MREEAWPGVSVGAIFYSSHGNPGPLLVGASRAIRSSLFALSKPNNPRPVPSLMALSSDRSSLLFLSRSVAVQVQEHQKRLCRRPLDGRVTERHMDAQAPPCSSQRRWGCRRPPPAREAARPVRPPSGWSGLSGGLSCLGWGSGGRVATQQTGHKEPASWSHSLPPPPS